MFKWKIKNDLPYAWEAAGTEFAESAISVWRPTKQTRSGIGSGEGESGLACPSDRSRNQAHRERDLQDFGEDSERVSVSGLESKFLELGQVLKGESEFLESVYLSKLIRSSGSIRDVELILFESRADPVLVSVRDRERKSAMDNF